MTEIERRARLSPPRPFPPCQIALLPLPLVDCRARLSFPRSGQAGARRLHLVKLWNPGENSALSANPREIQAPVCGDCEIIIGTQRSNSVCRLGPGLMCNASERLPASPRAFATTVRIKTSLTRALEVTPSLSSPLPRFPPLRHDNVSLSSRFCSRFLRCEVAAEGGKGVFFWRLTPPKTVSPPLTKVKWLKYSCSEMWLACHTLKMPY